MTDYPLLHIRGLDATTPNFRSTLVRLATAKGYDPSLVAAVIAFESGFDPKAKNKYSGASGLIQWMPPTASNTAFAATAQRAGMNVSWSDLPRLSAEQQLPLVMAWFDGTPLKSKGKGTAADYYLAVYSPARIGQDPSTVVARDGSTEYAQNPAFDPPDASGKRKGYYTVGDVARPVTSLVTAAQGRAPLLVPLALTTAAPSPRPPSAPSRGGSSSASAPSASPSSSGSTAPATAAKAGSPMAERSSGSPDSPDSQNSVRSGSVPKPQTPNPKPLSPRIGSRRTILREAKPSELPILHPGTHGPAVLLLQHLLARLAPGDEPALDLDAEYGPQTELWVALHQQEERLDPNGIVTTATWQALIDAAFSNDILPTTDRTPTERAPAFAPTEIPDADVFPDESTPLPDTVKSGGKDRLSPARLSLESDPDPAKTQYPKPNSASEASKR